MIERVTTIVYVEADTEDEAKEKAQCVGGVAAEDYELLEVIAERVEPKPTDNSQ